MSSHTIHVIGYAFVKKEGDTSTERLYYAMSRVEMEQQRQKARREGFEIRRWASQTSRGTQILGGQEVISEAKAPRVKLVDCDVCNTKGCIVCNYSGITTRTNKKHWMPWQIENMRKEYANQ